MKLELSEELTEFFLEVDIVGKIREDQTDYFFEELLFETNEYKLRSFIKYKKRFIRFSIYEEIRSFLKHTGHPIDEQILGGIIILFSLSAIEIRTVELINAFFSLVEPCRLKQYMFFNAYQKEKIATFKFNDFTIGNIDYFKFTNFIKNHSGSNYADKYKSSHVDQAGVEIKYFEVKAVSIYNWILLINGRADNLTPLQQEIINCYLTPVSKFFYSEFKKKFYKQQEFVNSYFGIYYPLDQFEISGYTLVNIFYNFSNHPETGWVLPVHFRITDIFFPDPKIIEKVNYFLSKNKEEIYESRGEFSRYFETVSSIFSSAEKHIHQKNYDHAFVDFFVGLDFLLAPDTEKSKKLKQRISLLTHKTLNIGFEEQVARLDMLYDIRSMYVHKGVAVEVPSLIELRNITRIIVAVLLQVHRNNLKNNKVNFTDWLKTIDQLVQGIYNKGLIPTEQQLSFIGVKDHKQLFLQRELHKYSF